MSFRKLYNVITKTDGEDENGNWVGGAETVTSVQMSVQPLGADDLKAYPDGRKVIGAVKAYSTTLLPDGSDGVTAPFILEAHGKRYECVSAFTYQSGVIAHYRYYLEYRSNTI